jgi:hypothetical protein
VEMVGPAGPQYMPAIFVGRITQKLDATALLVDFARTTTGAV